MALVVIVLGTISVILLSLLLMQRYEMKNIQKQLAGIRKRDTNALLHSVNGAKASDGLILEWNALIKEMRSSRIYYQQKHHDMEHMMTNISHDLRTPLTSAMGYVNIMKNTDLSQEEQERELAVIEKRLLRLEELINAFFEFSQIISSDEPPEKEELNLVAILEEAVAHYYDDYSSKSRVIFLHCDTAKLLLYSNRNLLLRIFDNLIGNALKHGAGNLTITVKSEKILQICFENQLSAAAPDTDRIFDEFYTTDISRTKGNTGLGLAIAKQFTQLLGGNIFAEICNGQFLVIFSLEDCGKG